MVPSFTSRFWRSTALAAGLVISVAGIAGVAAPAEPAAAAPVVYPYSCEAVFASGLFQQSFAQVEIEDVSPEPGLAELTVVSRLDDPTVPGQLHTFTGTTQWTSNNATIIWDGVTSPPSAMSWTVYPVADDLHFTTPAFEVPAGPGEPGTFQFDFVGDATIPPSPGPGYDTGHVTCRRGFRSHYSLAEGRLVERVRATLGLSTHEDAQQQGALFLAFLDGIIQAQGLTPPDLGSDLPPPATRPNSLTSYYADDELTSVLNTATGFSSDVPTLQRRGVLLLAYLLSLP
jgi:hypothetical protein